jgi:hypothetical protein
MDEEDIVSIHEQSLDEDHVRALTDNYVDEEISAQLESGIFAPPTAARLRRHALSRLARPSP